MNWLVAQFTDPSRGFVDRLMSWDFVKALVGEYADILGFPAFALIVWGGVASVIFVRTDSFLIPFGLLLFTGGAILSQIANFGMSAAVLITLVVPAAVITAAYIAYSR